MEHVDGHSCRPIACFQIMSVLGVVATTLNQHHKTPPSDSTKRDTQGPSVARIKVGADKNAVAKKFVITPTKLRFFATDTH
jgi:hypothetical protein